MSPRERFTGLRYRLSERSIGACYNVYNEFGYGLKENCYHSALKVELSFLGIPFESEVRFSLEHRGIRIGEYRADLIVGGCLIIECKAVEKLVSGHLSQLATYMKAAKIKSGLIFNFGPEPEIRRLDR